MFLDKLFFPEMFLPRVPRRFALKPWMWVVGVVLFWVMIDSGEGIKKYISYNNIFTRSDNPYIDVLRGMSGLVFYFILPIVMYWVCYCKKWKWSVSIASRLLYSMFMVSILRVLLAVLLLDDFTVYYSSFFLDKALISYSVYYSIFFVYIYYSLYTVFGFVVSLIALSYPLKWSEVGIEGFGGLTCEGCSGAEEMVRQISLRKAREGVCLLVIGGLLVVGVALSFSILNNTTYNKIVDAVVSFARSGVEDGLRSVRMEKVLRGLEEVVGEMNVGLEIDEMDVENAKIFHKRLFAEISGALESVDEIKIAIPKVGDAEEVVLRRIERNSQELKELLPAIPRVDWERVGVRVAIIVFMSYVAHMFFVAYKRCFEERVKKENQLISISLAKSVDADAVARLVAVVDRFCSDGSGDKDDVDFVKRNIADIRSSLSSVASVLDVVKKG